MTRTWGIIGAVATCGFALLALALYLAPESLAAFDTRISALAAADFGVASFFLAVTALGGGVGIIGAAICFAFLARLATGDVFRLAALLAATAFANKVLKDFFSRTRPDPLPWFDALPSFSFPSAHATSVVALYGFVGVVLYRRTRNLAVALMPLVVILLVGASRIVLGAHHASDVVGGYLLGLALLALALIVPFERILRIR